MTGTSKVLTRLGVTGLGAVLAFAGLTPLTEMSAFAATTSVVLTPADDTAAVGTCNAFTATVNTNPAPPGNTIDVNITQALPSGAAAGDLDIGFCNPSTSAEGNPTATTKPTGNIGGNTTAQAPSASQCTNTTQYDAAPAANDPNQVSCNSTFTDTNNDGTIIFGVTSNTVGDMTVTAFSDTGTANGVQDVGEPGDSSTKHWVANTTSASNLIDCSPETADNDTGDTHEFTCLVTNSAGVALVNQAVGFIVTAGPDAGVKYDPVTATGTGAPANATCTDTDDGTAGSTPGQATCEFTNNGTPGTDTISAYAETNGTSGQQAGEPTDEISKTFTTPPPPAPATSNIEVTCSPNATSSASDECLDDPSQDGSATFTATVTNGVPASPVAGVRVEFTLTDVSGGAADAGDKEELNTDRCITAANGQCSVTFTDEKPTDGESFDVEGTIDRSGGIPPNQDSDTANKTFHTPQPDEARNISVSPDSATQPSGGAQEFTASVTDRFGNPVNLVWVQWTETGPGSFRNNDECRTDETGKCSVEVSSLTAEKGAETVTATIEDFQYPVNRKECEAPAGRTFTGVNNSTTTPPGDEAPGAPAGNCSDSGTVTWQAASTTTKKQHPFLNCWSPRAHVLKCKVVSHPRVQGATVKFRKVHRDGTLGKIIAIRTTDASGVAKFRKKHLRSGKVWRVIARVGATPGVKGGYSNVDKTRIK